MPQRVASEQLAQDRRERIVPHGVRGRSCPHLGRTARLVHRVLGGLMDVPRGNERRYRKSLLRARQVPNDAHRSAARTPPPRTQRRLLGAREPRITRQRAGTGVLQPVPEARSRARWWPSARVRQVIGVACTAVAALGVGVVAYYLARAPSPPHATASGAVAVDPAVQQAETWIEANLSRQSPLTADASVADALALAGFTTDKFPAAGRWDANRIVVSTPAIHGDITRHLAASAARISSVPVAVFGPATRQVEVRMIVSGSASSLEHRMARDASDRVTAGKALLANRRLTADSEPRQVLRAGGLDLRATAVLALLATKADVHITQVGLDTPEAAAGSPARTVTLSLRSWKALTETLRMLPPAYAPSEIAATFGGYRTLTWSVGLAPPAAELAASGGNLDVSANLVQHGGGRGD